MRVAWSGELGWELHIPSANAVSIYKALKSASKLKNAGWRALTSLSAEKGTRHNENGFQYVCIFNILYVNSLSSRIIFSGYHLWNADLRANDNPIEANLAFTCRKGGDYIGNDKVRKAQQNGVTKKYAYFTLDDKVSNDLNQLTQLHSE